MDSRQLVAAIARQNGLDARVVADAVEAVTSALAGHCAVLDTVAIPGFGNFVAEKTDEHIVVDPVTLDRTLMPPAINVGFRPSVILRKRINESVQ